MTTPFRVAMTRLLMASALPFLASAAHAQAFHNGSFELPGVAAGTQKDISSTADAPTGWVPGGTLGGFSLFYEGTGSFSVIPQDGANVIGFGGNGNNGATLSQTFDTLVGDSYTVTFYTAAQQIGNGPQSFKAEAFNGSVSLGNISGAIPESANWVLHSFTFDAAGTSSRLTFTDTSNGGAAVNINWALDNVGVKDGSAPAVPEPGTWALMAAGLSAMVALGRRRSART